MRFHKLQGAGNDYVYVDLAEDAVADPAEAARLVSDRHFGIGADGLILIAPSAVADARMIMFNADGSEGSMCGNGIRSIAKYLFDRQRIGRKALLETRSGVVGIEVPVVRGAKAELIRVNMGRPRLAAEEIPTTLQGPSKGGPVVNVPLGSGGRTWNVTCVSMGNPHCVIFTADVPNLDLARIGPGLERHEVFPQRANVEFVEVLGPDRLRQRTWERGSGETWACGSGACAVGVAAALTGRTGRRVAIELLGGTLEVEWTGADEVLMTGPAEYVFSGEVDLEELAQAEARRHAPRTA